MWLRYRNITTTQRDVFQLKASHFLLYDSDMSYKTFLFIGIFHYQPAKLSLVIPTLKFMYYKDYSKSYVKSNIEKFWYLIKSKRFIYQ